MDQMSLMIEVMGSVLIFCPLIILVLWSLQAAALFYEKGWKQFKKLEKRIESLEAKVNELS